MGSPSPAKHCDVDEEDLGGDGTRDIGSGHVMGDDWNDYPPDEGGYEYPESQGDQGYQPEGYHPQNYSYNQEADPDPAPRSRGMAERGAPTVTRDMSYGKARQAAKPQTRARGRPVQARADDKTISEMCRMFHYSKCNGTKKALCVREYLPFHMPNVESQWIDWD